MNKLFCKLEWCDYIDYPKTQQTIYINYKKWRNQ